MTSDGSIDIKELVFLDAALKEFRLQPLDIQEAFDGSLTVVQNLKELRPDKKKDLSNNLKGISELRADYDKNTYRTYYVSEYREVIIVLDVGIKKSKEGGEIPKEQIARLIKRKKIADQLYQKHRSTFQSRYEKRLKNRERIQNRRQDHLNDRGKSWERKV